MRPNHKFTTAAVKPASKDPLSGVNDMPTNAPATAETVAAAADFAPLPSFFVWNIPSREPGYFRRVGITEWSVSAAREVIQRDHKEGLLRKPHALEDARDKDTALTAPELAYIMVTEPMAEMPGTEVPLSQWQALQENQELQHRVEAIKHTEAVLIAEGIDPEQPRQWVEGIRVSAQSQVSAMAAQSDLTKKALYDALSVVSEGFNEARKATGFEPIPEPVPVEPDYSLLTVYLPSGVNRADYPRLVAARVITNNIGAELSPDEREGLRFVTTALTDWLTGINIRFMDSEADRLKASAFVDRFKATFYR